MKVKIDKTFQVEASIEQAWALLSDPKKVVSCVPGAKITETIDERNYKGAVLMKVGPVVTDFKGDIEIATLDEDNHELVLKGNGKDAKGKGSATMTMTGRLRTAEGGATEVLNTMEVTVVGRLAQFGTRLMEDVSNRMFDQFVTCFQQKLSATAVPAAPAEAAAPRMPGEPVATAPATSAAPSSTATSPTATAPPEPANRRTPEPPPAEPEPVKALPLLFKALGSTASRFFRRLLGRSPGA
jgi:carbon monoxide dehydrogenase subunit G